MVGGGLMQLVAYGAQEVYFSVDYNHNYNYKNTEPRKIQFFYNYAKNRKHVKSSFSQRQYKKPNPYKVKILTTNNVGFKPKKHYYCNKASLLVLPKL